MKLPIIIFCVFLYSLQVTINPSIATKINIISAPVEHNISSTVKPKTNEKQVASDVISNHNSKVLDSTTAIHSKEHGSSTSNDIIETMTVSDEGITTVSDEDQLIDNGDSTDYEETDIFGILKPLLQFLRSYYSNEVGKLLRTITDRVLKK